MKIGILASEGSWYYRDLERAAKAKGFACGRVDFQRLVSSVGSVSPAIQGMVSTDSVTSLEGDAQLGQRPSDVSEFDVVLVRSMPPGSLEQVVYRMDVLARLDAGGTRVINSPKSLECAIDKYLTTVRLKDAGLPVPATFVCEDEDDAMSAFEQLGHDVVVKPLFGSEGRGIVRVSDPDLAHRTFRTLMRLNAVLYIQRFVRHDGFDVRVLVLDGQVLGAIRRRSANDFRTNVARNAVAEPHDLTTFEADFALRATAATGTFISGVDLLYDRDGECYVIEVNAVPGWQAFTRVTGIDIADKMMDRLSSNETRRD